MLVVIATVINMMLITTALVAPIGDHLSIRKRPVCWLDDDIRGWYQPRIRVVLARTGYRASLSP